MQRKLFNKKVWLTLLGLLIVAGAAAGIYLYAANRLIDRAPATEEPPSTRADTPGVVRLAAVGDMMPHATVNLRAQTNGSYDYSRFFEPVAAAFANPDILFCNQEAPSAGAEYVISGWPAFNAPREFAHDLNRVGCNLINLANNHVADKGMGALSATIETWEQIASVHAFSGANRSAAEQRQISYFSLADIDFALVAFSEFSNNTQIPDYAINIFSEELVDTLVGEAAANADFVIVSAHWGDEGAANVNAAQRQWAERIAAAGGDLILGHGPHTVQTVETIAVGEHETLVWYSLGNMLSSQLQTHELIGGVAVMDLVKENGGVSIENIAFLPTYMHYEWTDEEAAAEELLARDNLAIYPLHAAEEPLSRSQLNTTVGAEMERLRNLLNQHLEIPLVELDYF